MNRLVLALLVENNSGVLGRISGLFSRRGYNIESLTVGETLNPGVSRMTIVANGDEATLMQIQKQLAKLVEVIEIFELKPESSVYRELVLIKVEADDSQRSTLVSIVDLFRARIIDVAPNSLIIQVTGDASKIRGILAMLKGFNVIEMVRTGVSGMNRGLNGFEYKSHD